MYTLFPTHSRISFYPPQTKFREGNAFTGVCHSVHSWVRPSHNAPPSARTVPPWDRTFPPSPAQNHKSGRYASYWNTFLLQITFEAVIPLKMLKYWVTFYMDVQSITLKIPLLVKFHFTILESIHTCHLLDMNYCVNFSVHAIVNIPVTELFSPHKS